MTKIKDFNIIDCLKRGNEEEIKVLTELLKEKTKNINFEKEKNINQFEIVKTVIQESIENKKILDFRSVIDEQINNLFENYELTRVGLIYDSLVLNEQNANYLINNLINELKARNIKFNEFEFSDTILRYVFNNNTINSQIHYCLEITKNSTEFTLLNNETLDKNVINLLNAASDYYKAFQNINLEIINYVEKNILDFLNMLNIRCKDVNENEIDIVTKYVKLRIKLLHEKHFLFLLKNKENNINNNYKN